MTPHYANVFTVQTMGDGTLRIAFSVGKEEPHTEVWLTNHNGARLGELLTKLTTQPQEKTDVTA